MTPAFHLSPLRRTAMLLFFFFLPISTYAQADSFQRGLAALKENRMDDALADLTLAERGRPDDPLVRNFRGIVLQRLGRDGEADAEYKEAIRLNPAFEDAYRNLGFLKWRERQFNAAREALQSAVELSSTDSFAHYYLGRVELDERHYAPAIKELETSHVPLPADADFSVQLAEAYIAVGRQTDANKLLASIADTSLNSAQSVRVAMLFVALHKNEAAVATLQRVNAPRPPAGETWAQFDLALVYLLTGDFAKAIGQAEIYSSSLPRDDSKPKELAGYWTIIGIAGARLNQSGRAIEAFRHAAALVPEEEEYWLNLTRELMELSHYTEAIFAVQQGLAANPKSYALHLRLGAAQLAGGHYVEAESSFRELVEAGDPLPNGYVGLAQVLLRTGRAEQASAEIAAAEKKLGPNFLFSYFRGLALERAGKPRDALDAFQEAIKLNPGNAEAHLSVGKTYLNMGNVQQAITELQAALRLSPENEQAKRLLSKAYNRAGDAKQAAAFASSPISPAAHGEDNLVGDFFVPQWRLPPDNARPNRLDRKESNP